MDNSDLLFRKAEEADIARIWEIIGQAKAQSNSCGNEGK